VSRIRWWSYSRRGSREPWVAALASHCVSGQARLRRHPSLGQTDNLLPDSASDALRPQLSGSKRSAGQGRTPCSRPGAPARGNHRPFERYARHRSARGGARRHIALQPGRAKNCQVAPCVVRAPALGQIVRSGRRQLAESQGGESELGARCALAVESAARKLAQGLRVPANARPISSAHAAKKKKKKYALHA